MVFGYRQVCLNAASGQAMSGDLPQLYSALPAPVAVA